MTRASIVYVAAFAALPLTPAAAADLFSDDSFTPAVSAGPKWGAWASLGGAYGTEESSFGELIIFAPLMQTPDSLTFTELRAKYFEGDIIEGNAALGYRWMSPSGFNSGVWAGLDVRRTDSDNTFGQVSGGIEALSELAAASGSTMTAPMRRSAAARRASSWPSTTSSPPARSSRRNTPTPTTMCAATGTSSAAPCASRWGRRRRRATWPPRNGG